MNGKLFLDMIYELAAASGYTVDELLCQWNKEESTEWEEFKERALRHEL